MLSVLELRHALGLSQSAFARRLGVHKNSVINWERGHTYPAVTARIRMQVVARYAGLTRLHSGPLPIRRYNDDKMKYYEGKPGPRWRTMSGQQRSAFLSRRVMYARIRADIESGRAIGQPVVALLDGAPDLDVGA